MSFKSSLSIGKQGESIVKEQLESIGCVTKESITKEIDLYFAFEGKEFGCECKFDLYSGRSSNFAIETFNTKSCKPSGVMSTAAVFWFHVDSARKVYFCRVSALKEFIKKVKPKREVIDAGDGNANLMLYSVDVICEQCFLELNKENLTKEIKLL